MVEPDAPRRPGGASPSFQGQTVLVVDDEQDVLVSLHDLFEGALEGLNILAASSGPAALELIEGQPVDVIISDFKMPGMNGLEVLRRARVAAPAAGRILMTAYPDLGVAVRAINDAGIDSFVTKPFDPARLVEEVRAMLVEGRAEDLRSQGYARSMDLLRGRLPGGP